MTAALVRRVFPFSASFGLFASIAIGRGLTAEEASRYHELDAKPLHQFTNVDLAEYLDLRTRYFAGNPQRPSPADEIGTYALKQVGQQFRLPAKRFDLRASDCVTLVERCIALGYATDWESYYRLCERLRHKDGVVAVLERNFFTLADWMPNNAWLLEDITGHFGVEPIPFQYAVYRKRFYERLTFGEDDTEKGRAKAAAKAAKIASVLEKELLSDEFIAREDLPAVLPNVKTGDVCLVISRYEKPGLKAWHACQHLGVVIVDNAGAVSVVHSLPTGTARHGLIAFLKAADRIDGFKFLRVRSGSPDLINVQIESLGGTFSLRSPNEVDSDGGR